MRRITLSLFAAFLGVAAAISPARADAMNIDQIRSQFQQKTGASLAVIHEMALVQDVSTRLPIGKTLRQRVRVFTKGPMIRYEVEAPLANGSILQFLTIFDGQEAWTITPSGSKVSIDPDTHGGVRPDPLVKYINLSLGPKSTMKGEELFEGRPVVVVDNGEGMTIWLEQETMLPLQIKANSPSGGEVTWIFHNFRMVNNIAIIPHEIKFSSDDAVFYHHVGLVGLNTGLSDDLFDPDLAVEMKSKK